MTEIPPILRLEPTALVDDVLREYPATAAVFAAFGVDPGRGGRRPLRDADRDAGANCCALLAELEWALVADEPDAPLAGGEPRR